MHGPALALYRDRHPGVRLAACCDVDGEKAARFRESFGFGASYTDLDVMLAVERPDAVSLLVPPALTASLAVRIIERGFPLIMEKPPGLTADETLAIIAAARGTGVATRVAVNRRYMPVSLRMSEILAQEPRPALEHIAYEFYRVGRTDEDFSTTAIHAVDLVGHLAGSAYESVGLTWRSRERPLVDDCLLDCRFPSGLTARIGFFPEAGVETERITVSARDLTLFAELPGWEPADPPGSITVYAAGREKLRLTEGDLGSGTSPCERLGFYGENATFLDSLAAGGRPAGGVEESLQAVEIAAAIRAKAARWTASG